MNQQAKNRMNDELKNADNMEAVFSILGKYYDLKNCKPGFSTKALVIAKIPSLVLLMGAKPKSEFK